jgi:hypothetical protein
MYATKPDPLLSSSSAWQCIRQNQPSVQSLVRLGSCFSSGGYYSTWISITPLLAPSRHVNVSALPGFHTEQHIQPIGQTHHFHHPCSASAVSKPQCFNWEEVDYFPL